MDYLKNREEKRVSRIYEVNIIVYEVFWIINFSL